jgi:DNA-binding NarL/FixJ family response regulator
LNPAEPIKILIVDDQVLFAASLKVVLTGFGNQVFEVIGIAKNGKECLEFLKTQVPDLILMDVRMPEMDGVEATSRVHQLYPQVHIMMLTTFDDDSYVAQALAAGATGYVLKNIEPDELSACVLAVAKGTMLVSPSVGYRFFHQPPPEDSLDENPERRKMIHYLQSRFPDLKKREAEVLYLVIQGMDNHEIADTLRIASQTVKNYTSMIYQKIGVEDRLHAIQMLRPGA